MSLIYTLLALAIGGVAVAVITAAHVAIRQEIRSGQLRDRILQYTDHTS